MTLALIAEDEPLLAENLRAELSGLWPALRFAEPAGDGASAVRRALALRPDLLFLDIRMPGMSGLEAAQALAEDWPAEVPFPLLVFVTAYDQYALQAFDVHALDYLLKPFTARRFQKALERARAAVVRDQSAEGPVEQRLINLLDDLGGERRYSKRIVVKSSGRIHFVKVDEIDWVEAEGNYVRLHVGAHSHLLRETMKGMEAALDPDRFIRIHRSTIVNTERIKELQPLFHGEYAVLLQDGTRLVASRGPENRLRRMLETTMAR
jgi:two-component system, LytTR family, response regulator